METHIQLKHPAGKKAVRMTKGKYDVIRKHIIRCLKERGPQTHSEMMQAITDDFKMNKTKFEGSVEWHLEWVKLDLEAQKIIKRIGDKVPIRFTIVK